MFPMFNILIYRDVPSFLVLGICQYRVHPDTKDIFFLQASWSKYWRTDIIWMKVYFGKCDRRYITMWDLLQLQKQSVHFQLYSGVIK